MSSLSLPVLIAIFAALAAMVWAAGIKVSQTTDILSRRLGWGSAIGGLLVLAIVTNLPEMAIVMSGAFRGDLSLAVGNVLGGIAAQTVVLALLDRFGPRGRGPLTYRASSMSLVLSALLVIAILGLVLAGTEMPSSAIALRLTPATVLIAVVWFFGVRLIARVGDNLPWRAIEPTTAPATAGSGGGGRGGGASADGRAQRPAVTASTRRVAFVFAIGALVTLVGGVLLEQVSDAIADEIGMSGAVFGATVLAVATSLPDISTGLTSVRMGDDAMAMSDIFGGNALLPVLFLPAVIISGAAVLPNASPTDIFLTSAGIFLTVIYLFGLLLRPRRRIWGMGVDSALVLICYALTIGGLVLIS